LTLNLLETTRFDAPLEPLLAGFQKILTPMVIQVLIDTFLAAQLSDGTLAPESIQDNANLFLL